MIEIVKLGFTNCWIIKENDSVILVDGGMPGKLKNLKAKLKKLEISNDMIKALVQTHCHFDHIGSTAKIHEFIECPVIVHKLEESWIELKETRIPHGFSTWGKILNKLMKKWVPHIDIIPFKADIIHNGTYDLREFGISGMIIHTPGHTIGSSSVVLESGEAFVGDLAMSGLPKMIGKGTPVFGYDLMLVHESWKKLLELGVKKIYPAHGKPFNVSVFEKILSR